MISQITVHCVLRCQLNGPALFSPPNGPKDFKMLTESYFYISKLNFVCTEICNLNLCFVAGRTVGEHVMRRDAHSVRGA